MAVLEALIEWMTGLMLHLVSLTASAAARGIAAVASAEGSEVGPEVGGPWRAVRVTVRTSCGESVSLDLLPGWDVGRAKRELAAILATDARGLRLILAGRELADAVSLADCDLADESVLHAVLIVQGDQAKAAAAAAAPAGQMPMNETLPDLQLEQQPEAADRIQKATFFVYCGSTSCRRMQRGKLRVRCSECRDGVIFLERDPSCWRDVLQRRVIFGQCESAVCRNKRRHVEFFFKCASPEHRRDVEEPEETPPLYLVRSNIHSAPCLACLDVVAAAEPVVVFECADRHVVCVSCFVSFCRSRLNERGFVLHPSLGYTLSCPAGCENSFIDESRHFRLLGDWDYERYQRFAAEECVLEAGGVLCPQPGCGAGILVDDADARCNRVVCEHGCGYVFCRLCLQGYYHLGDCDSAASTSPDGAGASQSSFAVANSSLRRWVPSTDDSAAALRLIRLTTKPCPQCRTSTERDGGCMHMVCTKSACGFHWCWICQTEWTRECMANHWFG